jgi:hypothetical protein
MELYKWDPENCEVIFEESFEDNAHNYMWWKQIDGDASDIGTYYDGWSWSDARACDGDHSFKNTMYDEYKNMQDDYLVMDQCIDVSDCAVINVSFDTFVAAEYDTWWSSGGLEFYTPLDWLEFGVIDCGIMYYWDNGDGQLFITPDGYSMPGNYYFFDTSLPLYDVDSPGGPYKDYTQKAKKIDECPGWWHVWAEIPTELLQCPECFGIWFGFHSDKERVYEGAYVDNIVIKCCNPDGQKIYQGHSQNWLTIPEGTTQFTFPLAWDDVEPGTYKAILKVKNDEGGYDQIKEIVFTIGNEVDCAITDMYIEDDFTGEIIPDGGIMTYTADAHIPFTYHNGGNVPLEDVAVKATAYKLVEEELFFDDFEGMSNWVYFYEEAPLTALTPPDFIGDAWSGSKALYLGDPDLWHVMPGLNYIGYSQTYFDMEGVEEAWLDFYFMGALPAGAVVRVCVLGYSYIVGIGGVLEAFPGIMQTGGMCEMDWIGPMQPSCNYERVDFMGLWDIMVANGYMYDDNGHMTYDTGIGLWLDTRSCNDIYPTNCFAADDYKPWSGIFFDDISVSAKRTGDKIWEDSLVIPGPCDPSETCSDQFTWEDVPYSNYIVCVEAICEDDSNSQNDELCQTIIVLEDLEKMSKVDFIDYTDVDCPEWCISNVIGAGDHYALATNCDTHIVPDAESVGMGIGIHIDGDECCPSLIDISHLSICGPPPRLDYDFNDGPQGWTVVNGDGNEGTWHWGTDIPAACVAGGATGSWFYLDDDAAGSSAPPSTDNWLNSPPNDLSGYGALSLDWDGDFQDMAGDGELTVYANDGVTDYVVGTYTNDVGGFDLVPAIDISVIAGASAGVVKFHYTDDSSWAWGALIDNVAIIPPKSTSKNVVFTSGFEGIPFDGDFASNTGWTDSNYGYAHGGSHWAYSWAVGDTLTTPPITLLCDSELHFWYCAESSSHPMSLEVYCNGNLVFSDYDYDFTTYAEAIVDLSAYDETTITIDFVGLTSDFYGQLLDDVSVETSECEVEDCDEIPYEFSWQSSLYTNYNYVDFVVAGVVGEGMEQWSVYGEDAYGDGWDAYYDYIPDCFVDVYVNTDKVIDGFTVEYATNEVFFNVSEGDQVRACYYGDYSPEDMDYEDEHYWELRGPTGPIYTSTSPPARECIGPFGGGNCEGCPDETCPNLDWQVVETFTGFSEGIAVGDLAPYLPEGATAFTWAFIYHGPEGYPGIGFHLHDFWADWGTTQYYEDFEDGNKISEDYGMSWCDFCYAPGTGIWAEEIDTHTYQIDQPAGADNAIIWCTEIQDAYEAYFTGFWSYSIASDALLSLELSADGGNTWFTIALVGDDEDDALSSGHEMIPCTTFDLTPWAGQEICFRVRLQGQGSVTIDDFTISGKQDRMAPTVSIALSGNNIGGNMYAGPVTVKITAEDDMGMGEIHYVLDGTESVVSGDTASFTVSGDGSHNVEAWGIDATGNEGNHVSASFSIDASPPTVAITAPEPGLYLFGNKLLSMSKPFIIGAFTIEATADDAQGVYVVQFMLNGEVIGEDTEAPYDTYCAVKNMGGATIKAVAIDGVGNTAEDTLDVTYYKFL